VTTVVSRLDKELVLKYLEYILRTDLRTKINQQNAQINSGLIYH